MDKAKKVLVLGSGPIIIGQANCHSEGVRPSGRLKNLFRPYHQGKTLRFAQGDTQQGQAT